MLTALITSTMTKVLPGRAPQPLNLDRVVWPDRPLGLQLAWLPAPTRGTNPRPVRLVVEVDAECEVALFEVGLVPVQVPHWPDDKGPFLTDEPGLAPDPLLPLAVDHERTAGRTLARAELVAHHVGWNAVWLEVPAAAARRASELRVSVREAEGSECTSTVRLVQLDERAWHALSPDAAADDFHFLQWFHADSISSHHGLEVWSEEHWRLVAEHLASARRMGVTSAFVPVWTPPLDTRVGTLRTNVQLLGVTEHPDGQLDFDTALLDRFLGLCHELGFTAVELPHLFTQWGATATPQFWVTGADGQPERRFGWEVAATDPAWRALLDQLVPFLREHLTTRWPQFTRFWHISDEPNDGCLDSYTAAANVVRELLAGEQVVDALSEPRLAALVRTPIVATDHVEGFRRADLPTPWVYHCTVQTGGVANRFLALDGVRTRMLGAQLFAQQATGFLHWGLNFWFTELAVRPVDPWAETSAGGSFVSGDPFVIYPGDQTVVESQRHRLVGDAMRDRVLLTRAAALLGLDGRDGRALVLQTLNPDEAIDYDAGWLDNEAFEGRLLELARLLGTSDATPATTARVRPR